MPVSQQHPSKNWGVLWASLCTIALFWALEVKVVERDQVDSGAKSKAVILRITFAEWVWRRPVGCWLAEVVGKAVAFGLSKICGLFGAWVSLLRKIASASWIMHFPLDRSIGARFHAIAMACGSVARARCSACQELVARPVGREAASRAPG